MEHKMEPNKKSMSEEKNAYNRAWKHIKTHLPEAKQKKNQLHFSYN